MLFQNPFRCDITVQSRLIKFTVGGRQGSHKAATAVAVWLPNRNCTVRASCKAVFLHDERAQRHIRGYLVCVQVVSCCGISTVALLDFFFVQASARISHTIYWTPHHTAGEDFQRLRKPIGIHREAFKWNRVPIFSSHQHTTIYLRQCSTQVPHRTPHICVTQSHHHVIRISTRQLRPSWLPARLRIRRARSIRQSRPCAG